MRDRIHFLITQLIDEMKKYIVLDNNSAYIIDPVFHIIRNRVNAEICKTLVYIGGYDELAKKLINYITKCQNIDGSWNEIHPNYNQPSALITSFIGEALLATYDISPKERPLEKAKDYIISQEKAPGYFLKSSLYTADHLNVDASCGAFLAHYGRKFSDKECLESAKRAARRICSNQRNGFYPYTADKGSYPYIFNIPCIHYQGVTIHYLSKIHAILKEDWIKDSILYGTKWLSQVQNENGKFDWSKSGLMFAYYLNGAYAFALSSFAYASKWVKEYQKNSERCLNMLNKNLEGIVLRWERDSWISFLPSAFTTLNSVKLNNYPLAYRAFNFGYGLYRQAARRRFSPTVDDSTFNILCKALRIKPSTIEPFNNFPDMFMTSEVMDCLGYSLKVL